MEPIFVAVNVMFDEKGRITPQRITMPYGQILKIDRVLDARPVRSRKDGGDDGMRYQVKVSGQTVTLVHDIIWRLEWEE